MTEQMKAHVNAMLDGRVIDGAKLYLGEEIIEAATGHSRGEGSLSVLKATRHDTGFEMLEINDEARGYRGTVRKDDFFRILDGEEVQAKADGRDLRFEEGSRDRRAMWQSLNDDAARGGVA